MRLNTSLMLFCFMSCISFVGMTMVAADTDVTGENSTTVMLECDLHGIKKHVKTIDVSRCFYGDLCCCNFDAFDIADLLLTYRESIFTGRIVEVQELPDTLLVRRDVNAIIYVEKVFRGDKIKPNSKIHVRLTSDMFIWEDTGQSRIVARQTLANEHDAKSEAIWLRFQELDERNSRGEIDANEYDRLASELGAEYEQLGSLRWDWEGEVGKITRGRDGPARNCNDGRFTTDRFGALEIGATFLFSLDKGSEAAVGVHSLSDNQLWGTFGGDEMNDVIHALDYTNTCLSWPQIAYEPEEEYVAIDICADWARGVTRPGTISRRH